MSTGACAPVYSVHRGDPRRDRAQVLAIWHGNLRGRQCDERVLAAKYDWYYLDCPWGEPLLMLLRHEPSQSWVGVAAAGPRRMHRDGREIRAGVLVDLAVIAEHRTLGPALMLQRALLAAAPERFDLLYGMPNRKALPVFTRLGYASAGAGEMIRYVRVLRHGTYFARLVPMVLARPFGAIADAALLAPRVLRRGLGRRCVPAWHDRVDPRMAALSQAVRPPDALCGVRDDALLAWRFDRLPARRIRYLLLSARNGDRLCAWFACEVDGAVLHVRDFCIEPAHARDCIDDLAQAARVAGHAAISVEYAGSDMTAADWRACAFIDRARRPVIAWDAAQLGPFGHFTAADEDE